MPLKVWGGLTSTARTPALNGGMQQRTIVAATSKKRAVELLNKNRKTSVSMYEFNLYWAETGNVLELAVASTEGVWLNFTEFTNDAMPDFQKLI